MRTFWHFISKRGLVIYVCTKKILEGETYMSTRSSNTDTFAFSFMQKNERENLTKKFKFLLLLYIPHFLFSCPVSLIRIITLLWNQFDSSFTIRFKNMRTQHIVNNILIYGYSMTYVHNVQMTWAEMFRNEIRSEVRKL